MNFQPPFLFAVIFRVNNCIRKIDISTGTITTFAGDRGNNAGEGHLATETSLQIILSV